MYCFYLLNQLVNRDTHTQHTERGRWKISYSLGQREVRDITAQTYIDEISVNEARVLNGNCHSRSK